MIHTSKIKYLLFALAFFVFVSPAHAQSPTVVLSQGQLNASTTVGHCVVVCSDSYIVKVGNGYLGSTTLVVVAEKIVGMSLHFQNIAFNIQAFSDSAYTTSVGTCVYDSYNNSGSYDGFVQLDHVFSSSGTGCVMYPQYYYQITFSNDTSAGTPHSPINWIYGSLSNSKGWTWTTTSSGSLGPSSFYPMFSIVGPGWSLVPTSTSSGVFFSGAVDFCNNAFASTTGIGATIGDGLCIATGFLFIPNSDSVSAFVGIPNTIANSFPFSWIGQIRGDLQAAAATSSDQFIDLNINFGTSTRVLGFTTLDVISTTTVHKYLSDNTRNLMKTLLASVFYLAAAAFVYRSLQSVWQTS